MNKSGSATAIAMLLGMVLGLLLFGGSYVSSAPNVVNSFNTRTGDVALTSADVTGALTFTPARQADLSATNTNLANNYFTKLASDARFALLGSSYTKAESDARYAPNVAPAPSVNSLNNLTDDVTLEAGSNITITPTGNTLTIASNPAPQPPVNLSRIATLQWYDANQTGITYPTGAGATSDIAFDGANIWVLRSSFDRVTKLRASDGIILGDFGAGHEPSGIAFDGANIWITNEDFARRVTKFRASDGVVVGSFILPSDPFGIAFDGANIWVTRAGNVVTKLRASDGANLGTFSVGNQPLGIAFDGANIWVVNNLDSTVTKLRPSDGVTLGTFSVGSRPLGIAFDGANIWVANFFDNTVTKLRASDGANLGTFGVGTRPLRLAFDGANIWVTNNVDNTVTKLRASDGTTR